MPVRTSTPRPLFHASLRQMAHNFEQFQTRPRHSVQLTVKSMPDAHAPNRAPWAPSPLFLRFPPKKTTRIIRFFFKPDQPPPSQEAAFPPRGARCPFTDCGDGRARYLNPSLGLKKPEALMEKILFCAIFPHSSKSARTAHGSGAEE